MKKLTLMLSILAVCAVLTVAVPIGFGFWQDPIPSCGPFDCPPPSGGGGGN